MFRVAIKDIFARKRRLVTTGLAIVLGIAFLTGTQVLSGILRDSISSVVSNAYAGYDAVVRSPNQQELGFGQSIHMPVPADLVDKVRAVQGVGDARGVVETSTAQLIDSKGKISGSSFGPPTLVYNLLSDSSLQAGVLTEGRKPEADDEMVMDFSAAEEAGYSVGDKVSIATQAGTEKFKLVGLVGLGKDGTVPAGAKVLFFTTPTAQRLGQIPGKFSYIAVKGDSSGTNQKELANAISGAIPGVQVLTGEQFIEETSTSIIKIVDILSTFVTVFGYVALFVACFIIYNTFSILIAQRTRETALLRAIGAKRQQILAATVLEAAIVGLIASVIGLIAGIGMATVLKSVVGSIFTLQTGTPSLTGAAVATAFGVGVGVTVLSGFVPAWRASKVPPIAALTEAAIDRSGVSRTRVIWGVGLLVSGAVLAVLGLAKVGPSHLFEFGVGAATILMSVSLVLGPLIVGPVSRAMSWIVSRQGSIVPRLAGNNASRNPRRTAATAAALTIGVTLVTLIAVLASSIRASVDSAVSSSVKADYILSSSALSFGAGIPEHVTKEIAKLPTVAISSSVRFGPLRLTDPYGQKHQSKASDNPAAAFAGTQSTAPPGQDDLILGVEPKSFFEVVDFGRLKGDPSQLRGNTIATVSTVAAKRGWSLGDEIPVYFAATGAKKLKLVLIAETDVGTGNYFVPVKTFDANALPMFNVDFITYVKAREGADLNKLRSELDSLVADTPAITVQNISEYVKTQTAPFDTFLAVVYGLLLLAVIIALIGIANTLSLSVLERTRELGLLRAVGMSRKQLRRTIVGESVIIATFGTVLGLGLGILFSAALSTVIAADSPQLFDYTLPVGSLVVIAVVAALAGVLAALLPAWRASRLDVLAAIVSV